MHLGEQEDLVSSLEDRDRVITPAMERDRQLWEKTRVAEPEPKQRLTAPPLPSSPEGLFGCRAKLQDISGARCLELQRGDPDDEANKDRLCASGECLQGLRVRESLERMAQARHRVCSSCRRVQLPESNTDSLCSRCRPPDAEPPPLFETLAPPSAAPTSAPPSTTEHQSAPPPPPKEEPMVAVKSERRSCSVAGCIKKLRSNNTTGKCTIHAKPWLAKKAAAAAEQPARNVVKPAAAPPDEDLGELPDVRTAPVSWLIAAVREYQRRKAEAQQLLDAAAELDAN